MRLIASTIGRHYGGVEISVQWVLFPSAQLAQRAVLEGQAHLTDIYFFLGQPSTSMPNQRGAGGKDEGGGEPQRHGQPLLYFYPTCPVVGAPVELIVREDEWGNDAIPKGLVNESGNKLDNSSSSPFSLSSAARRRGLAYLNRRIDGAKEGTSSSSSQRPISGTSQQHHASYMSTPVSV